MRGGQWQVLRLVEGLAAAGVESTLLAREGAPLYRAARKQGWRVEPLGITRAHALAARPRPDALPRRAQPLAGRVPARTRRWWYRGGWRSRWARAGNTAGRGATWRFRSS